MSFIAELKRRNVFRAAAFYAASAWLLVQVATQVFPFFHVAEWVVRWIVIAAVIGFPFAMLFSWFYEWTPHGIVRESEVAPEASVTRATGRKLDRWIIAIMALAIVLLLADIFVPHRNAGTESATSISDKSIAVLAFTDLSPAHDQGYFSDGMSEEILNALAQVKDLKVAGRTSSFYFKGRNEDLRTMGKALGVANVLEGSVRKQGNKVRITAQLIQVSDDTHLWSHDYDGDLSDVFALQDNIARSITDALKVVLVGGQKDHLVPVATTSAEAYPLYLQATAIFNRRDGAHIPDAIADLQEAIRLDPKYARAHARLASLYAIASVYTALDATQSLAAGEHEAQVASGLDPTLAEPYAALGTVHEFRRQWVAARAAAERAVALDPRDSTAIFWLGLIQTDTGYRRKGIASIDRALAIDPLLPNALAWRGFWYFDAGDRNNARRMAQRSADEGLHFGDTVLAMLAYAEGHDADAVVHLTRGMPGNLMAVLPDGATAILAQGAFGDAIQRARAVAVIDTYLAGQHKTVSAAAPWALLMLGEHARALELSQASVDTLFLSWLWSTQGAAARKLPQFPEFTRRMGLVEVWEKYGPPDACKRKGPDDYVCE